MDTNFRTFLFIRFNEHEVVARPGIESVKDLKGKKVGVEVGFVSHLLLIKALEANDMTEVDIEIVNIPTHETPQELMSVERGFTSADIPGLIYDMLFVLEESLDAHRDEWLKVVKV